LLPRKGEFLAIPGRFNGRRKPKLSARIPTVVNTILHRPLIYLPLVAFGSGYPTGKDDDYANVGMHFAIVTNGATTQIDRQQGQLRKSRPGDRARPLHVSI
jgi:hypothetical protein